MIPRWRKWLCLASTLVWPGFGQAGLTPVEVPLASDLRHEGAQAERDCVPLLLEFSAYGCEYCSLLEEEILKPMLRNRDYDRRVVMRKLVLGRDIKLDSFSGNRLTPAQLRRWQLGIAAHQGQINHPIFNRHQKQNSCCCQHSFRRQPAIGLVRPFMIVEP